MPHIVVLQDVQIQCMNPDEKKERNEENLIKKFFTLLQMRDRKQTVVNFHPFTKQQSFKLPYLVCLNIIYN